MRLFQALLHLIVNLKMLKPTENFSAERPLKLYLFPWQKKLCSDKEFRVFVCKNRITAISQQNLYRVLYFVIEVFFMSKLNEIFTLALYLYISG